jgi:hypothetical protein
MEGERVSSADLRCLETEVRSQLSMIGADTRPIHEQYVLA